MYGNRNLAMPPQPVSGQPSSPPMATAPGSQPMPTAVPMAAGPQFAPFRQHLIQALQTLNPQEREFLRLLMSKPQFVVLVVKLFGEEFADIIERNATNARQARGIDMGGAGPQPGPGILATGRTPVPGSQPMPADNGFDRIGV